MLDGAERRVSAIPQPSDIAAEPLAGVAEGAPSVHSLRVACSDAPVLTRIALDAPDLIIHLARRRLRAGRSPTGDLGMAVTCRARLALVEACRRMARPPVFVSRLRSRSFSCADNGHDHRGYAPAPRPPNGTPKADMASCWCRRGPGAASSAGAPCAFPPSHPPRRAQPRGMISAPAASCANSPRGAARTRCPWAATCGCISPRPDKAARLHAAEKAWTRPHSGRHTADAPGIQTVTCPVR